MLARAVNRRRDGRHMTVIFSTYHSLEVIPAAQRKYGLPKFDLILCDEAHRTMGAVFDNVDESAFVQIHDQAKVKGRKRVHG